MDRQNSLKLQISRQLAATALLSLALATTACSGFKFQESDASAALQSVSNGGTPSEDPSQPTAAPACVTDYADFVLDENLIDFEIVDGANVTFGFNLAGILKVFGITIDAKKGQMTMEMHMHQAVDLTESVADVPGTASSTDASFDMNLDFVKLGADVGYFYKTPLSTLTANTIKSGLNAVQAKLTSIHDEWNSRIVWTDTATDQYIIPAGTVAGVRVGDQFNIYNINYIWKGDACTSELLMPQKTTTTPVALATVIQVADGAAVLQVTVRSTSDVIAKGAQAFVANLPLAAKEKSRPALGKSVRMGQIQSAELPVTGATSVDLTNFLSQQTLSLLNTYGFYPLN